MAVSDRLSIISRVRSSLAMEEDLGPYGSADVPRRKEERKSGIICKVISSNTPLRVEKTSRLPLPYSGFFQSTAGATNAFTVSMRQTRPVDSTLEYVRSIRHFPSAT